MTKKRLNFNHLIVLLILNSFIFFNCNGQILNVEKSRILEDSTQRLIGNFGLTFSLNNRSTRPDNKILFIGLNGNTSVGYFSDKNSYLFFGAINYTSITGAQPISTGFAHFRINFNRKNKLSTEVFSQIQYDETRGMTYRALAGAGLRYNLFKDSNTSLYFGTGVMWETEEWKMPGESDSIVVKNIPKSTNYISVRTLLNPFTTFNIINYYQVGYDNQQEIFRQRLSVEASLIFSINKYLSFTNTFNAVYENRPIVPILRFAYTLSNGILIKF